MARHTQDEPSFGRTALMAAGVAAGVLCAVVVAVLIVGTLSSAPSANPAPLDFDATAAAKSSAASSSSGRASTSARASSSSRPSSSATPTASPTHTSAQVARATRSSSAAPAPTTRSRTSSSSRAPAPSPKQVSRVVTISLPALSTKVSITMPQDWVITDSPGRPLSGDGVHSGTWSVVGRSSMSVTVAGPSGSGETMQVHISGLTPVDRRYSLS